MAFYRLPVAAVFAAKSRSNIHEICERFGLHLSHHLAPVGLNRDLADAKLESDLLIQETANDQSHDFALAPTE